MKHQSKSPRGLVLAISLVTMPFMAQMAAADVKILPATVCQAHIPPDIANNPEEVTLMKSSIRYSMFGRVENGHPSRPLTVVCPLVRDATLDYVRVYAFDNFVGDGANGVGALRCTVRSNNRWGTSALDFQDWNTSDHPSIEGTFSFGSYAFMYYQVDDKDGDEGGYTLTCTIPPPAPNRSFIGMIKYKEN